MYARTLYLMYTQGGKSQSPIAGVHFNLSRSVIARPRFSATLFCIPRHDGKRNIHTVGKGIFTLCRNGMIDYRLLQFRPVLFEDSVPEGEFLG